MSIYFSSPPIVIDGDVAYAKDVNDIVLATSSAFDLIQTVLENLELSVQTWALLAQTWAENPEDLEVTTGAYSALHWAKKSAASAVAALASQNAAAGSASAAAADLVATNQDTIDTAADRVQTGLDRVQTAADRVQTGLDVVATAAVTNADVVLTHADVVLTHADAAQTALDLVATNQDTIDTAADLVQTNQDTIATAADRVQTGLDVIATAADRVQTGLDLIATNQDTIDTAADLAELIATLSSYYYTGNILGAVSQVAGVPTGAVIESGSNANGEYIRFADGGMICIQGNIVGVGGTPNALANIAGLYSSNTHTWTYPAAFVDAPVVSVNAYRTVADTIFVWGAAISIFSSNATMRAASNTSSGTVGFNFTPLAIGRWF